MKEGKRAASIRDAAGRRHCQILRNRQAADYGHRHPKRQTTPADPRRRTDTRAMTIPKRKKALRRDRRSTPAGKEPDSDVSPCESWRLYRISRRINRQTLQILTTYLLSPLLGTENSSSSLFKKDLKTDFRPLPATVAETIHKRPAGQPKVGAPEIPLSICSSGPEKTSGDPFSRSQDDGRSTPGGRPVIGNRW